MVQTKFAPVGRGTIQWNELLAPNRNHDDHQQLWLTKLSARGSQWRILRVMMHAMHNVIFVITDVAFKILTFLKANYLKYQVIAKLLNNVTSKGLSN